MDEKEKENPLYVPDPYETGYHSGTNQCKHSACGTDHIPLPGRSAIRKGNEL